MSKVYLVSEGDYSDYSVVAVFSTVEKAEAYVAAWEKLPTWRESEDGTLELSKYYSRGYRVERDGIDLDPLVGPETGQGAWAAGNVHVCANGEPYRLYPTDRSGLSVIVSWDEDATVGPPEVERVSGIYGEYWRISATGKTPEHAQRSLRELLRAIKAGTFILSQETSAG